MLRSSAVGGTGATAACTATCMRLSPTLNAPGTTATPVAQRSRRAAAQRSLFSKRAATTATGDSSSDGSGSSDSPPKQQQYAVGASVYDASHHGSCRGYGTIVSRADPADDGTQRWKVEWLKSDTHSTAIKETYLDLPLIQCHHRKAPSGLNQPILVVLGTHKGKAGETVRKSGTGFSCKLDDVHGLHHCNPDTLHATGPPPKDKELQQFQATLLAEHLPVAELQGWLTAYQEDPPCDLLRSKPDSGVWCDAPV